MSSTVTAVTPSWLALREPADAAARAVDILEPLRRHLAASSTPLVVHDLGSGTGSMLRWLAPRLPGPQHWLLLDLDAELLQVAGSTPAPLAVDGTPVTVATHRVDVTTYGADLSAADLVTASALLDLWTERELQRVVDACALARVPVLFTLSVSGRVSLHPVEPLDCALAGAFNAHQRRFRRDGLLLGPVAGGTAAELFRRAGFHVSTRPSPWLLGPDDGELVGEWLTGWVHAACEQVPRLAPAATGYLRRRKQQLQDGALQVTVQHRDLLALPDSVPT